MSKLHDRFANFLSEVEQMEKNNDKLTEDIQQLEKEKTDGYSKFNTETHALISKDDLEKLSDTLNDIESDVGGANISSDELRGYADEVNSCCGYAEDSVHTAHDLLDAMLGDKGDE